jgi:hypothetical protein
METATLFGHAVPASLRRSPLQVLQLALALLSNVLGVGTQCVLHFLLPVIDPDFDRRRRQVVGPAGLGPRHLALNDSQHQRGLAPHRPALDFLFDQRAHGD